MSKDIVTPEEITAKLAEKGIGVEEPKKAEAKEEVVSTDTTEEVVSEDTKDEVSVAENATVDVEDAATDDIEERAKAEGWKPDGPKTAEQFLHDGEFIKEIKARGKEIKSLKKQMDEMMSHISKMKKAGYQERLDVIQAEREDAVARSDFESLEHLDEELYKVKNELSKEDIKPEEHPAAVDFVNRHKDIFNDFSLEAQEIKNFLAERDVELANYNLDPELHIQTLERDLQTMFPQRFKQEVKETPKAAAVESDVRPVTKGKRTKYTFDDLSYEQKQVCRGLERKGVMSKDEYIKQLIEIGDLK